MISRLRRHAGLVLVGVTVVSVLIGLWQKYPCANGHAPPDYSWTRACYSDVLPLYSGRGLGSGKVPYVDSWIEYPVLIGLVMGLIGLPIHALGAAGRLDGPAHSLGFETVDQGVVFFWATGALSGLLVVATTWMLYRMRSDRPRDVLLWAAAPTMVLAFPVNWDMVAVAPAVAALLAWHRSRPGWTGVFIGLGTAAKLYPVLFLLPIVLLCLRHGTPAARRVAARVVATATATWLAVNVPVAVADLDGWWQPYRFSATRWIDWGSLYYLADHLSSGVGLHQAVLPAIREVSALNRTSLLLFVGACVGIAVLVFRAPRPPRTTAVAFLVVAAFLLTNKVWSQQFVLWLVPLVVLARPRWTPFGCWQAVELAYLVTVLRVVLAGKDDFALVETALARYLALALLVALVVADALRPDRDALRGPDGADPDAGPLATPDAGGSPTVEAPSAPAPMGAGVGRLER